MINQIIEKFKAVYISPESLDSQVAKRLKDLFPKDRVYFEIPDWIQNHKGSLTAQQFNESKKNIVVKPFQGDFFKRCPGASQKKLLSCCNYYVLNLGQQCDMNCSYCYLQSYINSPALYIYSNIDKALNELTTMAEKYPDHPYRVGTGEVIDSLSLDPLTLHSVQLIEFFKKYPKWTLEFKTKSNFVDQFIDCEHGGNVVVSWSINAAEVTQKEEHGTANLEQRLLAAEKCRDRGFKVAFHIDPLIHYSEWKKGYADLVSQITKRFKPEDLHVISVGTLRFQGSQRLMMRERFGFNSLSVNGEMFQSEAGKFRYDQSLREEMYKHVLNAFNASGEAWKIFMCMETPETWISTFEEMPLKNPDLKDMFKPLPKTPTESSLQG